MSPSFRNTVVYLLAFVCIFVLASRLVTIGLLVAHAPGDAEQYFFLKQISISAICAVAAIWLWGKRVRQEPHGSDES